MRRREFTSDLMLIAPSPSVAGHDRAHNSMPGFVEMPSGVLAWRGVAAADVAAGHALVQRYPLSTFFQAFFAGVWRPRRRKIGFSEIFEMCIWFIHSFNWAVTGSGRAMPVLFEVLGG